MKNGLMEMFLLCECAKCEKKEFWLVGSQLQSRSCRSNFYLLLSNAMGFNFSILISANIGFCPSKQIQYLFSNCCFSQPIPFQQPIYLASSGATRVKLYSSFLWPAWKPFNRTRPRAMYIWNDWKKTVLNHVTNRHTERSVCVCVCGWGQKHKPNARENIWLEH